MIRKLDSEHCKVLRRFGVMGGVVRGFASGENQILFDSIFGGSMRLSNFLAIT